MKYTKPTVRDDMHVGHGPQRVELYDDLEAGGNALARILWPDGAGGFTADPEFFVRVYDPFGKNSGSGSSSGGMGDKFEIEYWTDQQRWEIVGGGGEGTLLIGSRSTYTLDHSNYQLAAPLNGPVYGDVGLILDYDVTDNHLLLRCPNGKENHYTIVWMVDCDRADVQWVFPANEFSSGNTNYQIRLKWADWRTDDVKAFTQGHYVRSAYTSRKTSEQRVTVPQQTCVMSQSLKIDRQAPAAEVKEGLWLEFYVEGSSPDPETGNGYLEPTTAILNWQIRANLDYAPSA